LKQKIKWKRFFAFFIIAILLLGGCGRFYLSEKTDVSGNEKAVSLGLTPVFSYSVPESRPSVLVNQVGYLPDSDKTALFIGKNIPDKFQVIDQKTGKSVYQGEIASKGIDKQTKKNVSYGSFSDVRIKGTYYLKCDTVGCSYLFDIGEDTYDPLLKGLTDKLGKAADVMTGSSSTALEGGLSGKLKNCGNVVIGCETASVLLLAYELYPGYFNQNLEGTAGGVRVPAVLEQVRDETNWMFTMQDPSSGGVYAGITNTGIAAEGSENGELKAGKDIMSSDATAYYAATMAKFGYLYQQYDSTYATKCLKASVQAWQYLQTQKNVNQMTDQMYYAAAELYRATGEYGYQRFLQQNSQLVTQNTLNEYVFFGDVTYLLTKRRVDTTLCNSFITRLIRDSEEIAEEAGNNCYQVDEKGNGTNEQNILWNMLRMAVVDYVITNHEYTSVIEDHVNYLMGQNSDASCLVPDFGDQLSDDSTKKDAQIVALPQQAELLLLVNALTSEKDIITGS